MNLDIDRLDGIDTTTMPAENIAAAILPDWLIDGVAAGLPYTPTKAHIRSQIVRAIEAERSK